MKLPAHDSLSDKALLEAAQHGDDDAAALLTKRLLGHVPPSARSAWPALRDANRIGIRERRVVFSCTPLAYHPRPRRPDKP